MKEPRPPLRLVEGGSTAAAQRAEAAPSIELMALGTALVLSCVLLARIPSWRAELGLFQSLYAVAFVFYALALLRPVRRRPGPLTGPIVLVVALAARLALLPSPPTLSDDVYRYVWEGRVALAGENPYRTPPADPRLEPLRDRTLYPRINHPHLATVYPPLMIAQFAGVAAISPTVWAMKLWIVLCDLLVVAVLLGWARRQARKLSLVVAYAWCPLVLVEFAGSGHNDPLALLWLAAALAWSRRQPALSALALALGALTKLAPLLALPFLWREWPWRARILCVVLAGAGLGWFLAQTPASGSGLDAYGRTWQNNELLFHYLLQWTGDPVRARAFALVALLWAMAWLLWRRRDPAAGARDAMRATLLVSPVAHPWYFAWPLLLEPLGPSAPWILLSLTCVLSYGVLVPPPEGGAFHLPVGWRWVEYGVPLALAVALAWRARRQARSRKR